jgi:hypothetical protein
MNGLDMNWRNCGLVLTTIVAFSLAFWLYGIGRTMRETVTFTASGWVFGMLLSFFLPLLLILPMIRALRDVRATAKLAALIGAALLAGSVTSEVAILQDEHRFSMEAARATGVYSRPRAWPNGAGSLVWVPGQGIHATD